MSRVLLIAADKSLPLCDRQQERTTIVHLPDAPDLGAMRGKEMSVAGLRGFLVEEHAYYRPAVDALGCDMKPFQYQLHLEAHPDDLQNLLDYLRKNFLPGETAELWNLWVGVDRDDPLFHFRGALSDFDMETLEQFLDPLPECGKIGQCRMTVSI